MIIFWLLFDRFFLLALALCVQQTLAQATTAAQTTTASTTTTSTAADLPSCSEAGHEAHQETCMSIQTTCTTALETCEAGDSSLQEACVAAAELVFTNALAAVTFTDCECDISCSGSSMLLFSVFAVFMKFLF